MEQAGFKHLTLTRPHLIRLEVNSWGHGQDSTSPGPLGILCKSNQSYPSPVLCSCLVHSCPMPTQSPVDLKSHSPPIANAVLLLNFSQGPEAEEREMPMFVQNSSCKKPTPRLPIPSLRNSDRQLLRSVYCFQTLHSQNHPPEEDEVGVGVGQGSLVSVIPFHASKH